MSVPCLPRVLVLTDLVALWDIRIEVVLAVKLAPISELPAYGAPYAKNVPYCLFVKGWERAGVRHTDRADVHVWTRLV
jgi:hypothetical protein